MHVCVKFEVYNTNVLEVIRMNVKRANKVIHGILSVLLMCMCSVYICTYLYNLKFLTQIFQDLLT